MKYEMMCIAFQSFFPNQKLTIFYSLMEWHINLISGIFISKFSLRFSSIDFDRSLPHANLNDF